MQYKGENGSYCYISTPQKIIMLKQITQYNVEGRKAANVFINSTENKINNAIYVYDHTQYKSTKIAIHMSSYHYP